MKKVTKKEISEQLSEARNTEKALNWTIDSIGVFSFDNEIYLFIHFAAKGYMQLYITKNTMTSMISLIIIQIGEKEYGQNLRWLIWFKKTLTITPWTSHRPVMKGKEI